MSCFICDQEFGKFARHPYLCAAKNRPDLTRQQIRYEQICHDSGKQWIKEDLSAPYQRGEGLPFFRSTFGLAYGQTRSLLRYFGIPQRGVRESLSAQRVLEQKRATCLSRYGVSNPSQNDAVKAKKRATFQLHFGVDNIFATETFKLQLKQTMVAKYGQGSVPNLHGNADHFGWNHLSRPQRLARLRPVHDGFRTWFGSLTDDQRTDYIRKRIHTFGYTSSLETRILSILTNLGVEVKQQFFLSRRVYDFKVIGCPVLIEVQGDFWHANPLIYQAGDLLSFPGGSRKAGDLWAKDEKKAALAKHWGYRLIPIWESFMRKTDDQGVAEFLVSQLTSES